VVARGAKLLEHPEAAQAGALWTPRRGLEGRVGDWPAFPGVQRTFSGAPTSHVRASSATAPRLPDADQSRAPRLARRGISRFPSTLPGRAATSATTEVSVAAGATGLAIMTTAAIGVHEQRYVNLLG
jgi:hypothetical protein